MTVVTDNLIYFSGLVGCYLKTCKELHYVSSKSIVKYINKFKPMNIKILHIAT